MRDYLTITGVAGLLQVRPARCATTTYARVTSVSITSRTSSGQPELVREQVEHLIERGPRRLAGLVDETQGQHGVVFG
jgi:hypothetical protein